MKAPSARGPIDRVYGPPRAGAFSAAARDLRAWIGSQHVLPIAGAWAVALGGLLVFGGPRLVGQAAGATYLLVALYGLHLLTVETGQPSLGQAGFLALGAYLTAALRLRLGVDGVTAAAISALGAGLAGLALGYGTSRLPPATLALATWAFGWLVFVTAAAYPGVGGGAGGMTLGAPMRLSLAPLGLDLVFREPQHLLLGSALLAVVLVVLRSAHRSTLGLQWSALRDSRSLPRALGYDVAATRRWAFFASALLAGLAGSLGAQLLGVVDSSTFSPVTSLLLFAAVLIGSPLGFAGPLVGLAVTVGVPALVDLVGSGIGLPVDRVRGVLTALATILALVIAVRASTRARLFAAPVEGPVAQDEVREAGPRRRRRRKPGPPVLEVTGMTRAYGGITALDRVSLVLAPGEIRGLMGPNGSGKSTFLRCISGTIAAGGGSVRLLGRDVTGLDEVRRSRAGIMRTFQRTVALPGLTAAAHAELGLGRRDRAGWLAAILKTPRYRTEAAARETAATEVLRLFGIEDKDSRPESLPAGRQRLLQVAAAAAAQPLVLLLDEPSAGMSGDEIAALEGGLRVISAAGTAVLLVEHDVAFLRRICDRITVLSEGRELMTGAPYRVVRDRLVRSVYLGPAPG